MSTPRPVEYLYSHDTLMCGFDGEHCPCYDLTGRERWDYHVVRLRITKKTPKRIYYVRDERFGGDPKIGFVDRQELEANGEAKRRSSGWWERDAIVYAAPPEPPPSAHLGRQQPSLSELRVEMANAHPDRGGNREAFEVARSRYLAAKRRAAP